MKRSLALAFGAILFSVVMISLRMRSLGGSVETPSVSRTAETMADRNAQVSPKDNLIDREHKTDTKPIAAAAPQVKDEPFQRWIEKEAKALDAPTVDGQKKREEIKAVVSQLTPQQSQQLLATARDPNSAAGEKILSTYLLVEGGRLSRGELTSLIASPLENTGPIEAHSEAETTAVREKSLRIMAIDGLFARAHKEPEAREALAKVISDIQDPYLRAYAQEKYQRLIN